MSKFRAGVLFGQELLDVYEDAKKVGYALPGVNAVGTSTCLLYTSPSPRDRQKSRMPSSA